MKIFVDTANVKSIKEAMALGIVDGVTTNPSLVAKEGDDPERIVKEICELVQGKPVNAEILSLEHKEMVKEARAVAAWADNIVIKIPMMKDGLKTVKVLSDEGIKTNVTLIFSATQAILSAKAGASYVSPFVGRLDDISHQGMDLVADIIDIYENYMFETEVIVASVRNPLHVVEAAKMGAHVATIPYGVITQLIKHPLTDSGLKKFLKDWETLPKPAGKKR